MSMHVLEQRSGGYRLMGFDFMLDDNMNLWFIEANTGPQNSQWERKRRHLTEVMYRDALEIEFVYLRSRVKRLRDFVKIAVEEYRQKQENWDKETLRGLFEVANKEKLEPEFSISSTNMWEKIIDLSLEGTEEEKHMGLLDNSCFTNENR